MTDKQMIIDGVDVSGCSYYQHNMCTATKDDYGDCSLCCQDYDMNDCYYKQLARANEENEKLKTQIKNEKQALQIDIDNLNQACLDLSQENYDLLNKLQAKEKECEALQMSDNEAVEIIAELTAYKDINEDFKTAWEELKTENGELKKIINEAKNSKLDLKSFLVGEAVQNEYEQQLDQLNAKNEELKKELEAVYDDCKGCPTCNEALYNANLYAKEYKKLKQTLDEIEEFCIVYSDNHDAYENVYKHILEIINETKDGE